MMMLQVGWWSHERVIVSNKVAIYFREIPVIFVIKPCVNSVSKSVQLLFTWLKHLIVIQSDQLKHKSERQLQIWSLPGLNVGLVLKYFF